MDGNEGQKWTPEDRVKRTVLLAKDIEMVREIRRELYTAVLNGVRFNAFLKARGYEPAAWEGLIAGLIAGGKLAERETIVV